MICHTVKIADPTMIAASEGKSRLLLVSPSPDSLLYRMMIVFTGCPLTLPKLECIGVDIDHLEELFRLRKPRKRVFDIPLLKSRSFHYRLYAISGGEASADAFLYVSSKERQLLDLASHRSYDPSQNTRKPRNDR
jgi:hypothetical protein